VRYGLLRCIISHSIRRTKHYRCLKTSKDSRSNGCSLVYTCNILCIQWFPKLQISHVCIIWAKTVDVSYVMSMTTLGISECLNWNIVPYVFDCHVCFLHLILPISCTILCCQQPRIMLVLSQVMIYLLPVLCMFAHTFMIQLSPFYAHTLFLFCLKCMIQLSPLYTGNISFCTDMLHSLTSLCITQRCVMHICTYMYAK
jgi:hypothetical protein